MGRFEGAFAPPWPLLPLVLWGLAATVKRRSVCPTARQKGGPKRRLNDFVDHLRSQCCKYSCARRPTRQLILIASVAYQPTPLFSPQRKSNYALLPRALFATLSSTQCLVALHEPTNGLSQGRPLPPCASLHRMRETPHAGRASALRIVWPAHFAAHASRHSIVDLRTSPDLGGEGAPCAPRHVRHPFVQPLRNAMESRCNNMGGRVLIE